jgi:uncharacterized heparinase superfamily protein
MEAALRATNIAQAFWMFSDAPEALEPDFLCALLLCLAEHQGFVAANLEDAWRVSNNHLLADLVGLLVVGSLFPRLPAAGRTVAKARAGLGREVPRQVHPDGASFEGAVPYHRLAVELLTLAELSAQCAGAPMGDEFRTRLERMYEVAVAYCSQAGLAPQLGDNDSGRAFALTDRPSLDHGYLGPLGAALFGAGWLRREGAAFPDEGAWLLGDEGRARYEALPEVAEEASFSSPPSGLHVLRGGGAVLAISAGPSGQRGLGGHSHNDKLSFELHLGGTPVIVDPGSPTYGRDPGLRNQYRGTAFHNTVELDGQEQSPLDLARLFALPDRARAEVLTFEEGPTLAVLRAEHHGYERFPDPVTVRRTFVLEKAHRALLVLDRLAGATARTVALRLHLGCPDASVRPAVPWELERLC